MNNCAAGVSLRMFGSSSAFRALASRLNPSLRLRSGRR